MGKGGDGISISGMRRITGDRYGPGATDPAVVAAWRQSNAKRGPDGPLDMKRTEGSVYGFNIQLVAHHFAHVLACSFYRQRIAFAEHHDLCFLFFGFQISKEKKPQDISFQSNGGIIAKTPAGQLIFGWGGGIVGAEISTRGC